MPIARRILSLGATGLTSIMLALGSGPADARTGQDPSLWPQVESAVATSSEIEARVAALLARMSVEEKVGQIFQVEIQHVTPEDIRDFHLGSVLNGGGSLPNRNKYATPGEWLALADRFYDASMDASAGGVAIPIIWGSDAVHGHNNVIGATLFPHNIGLGAANNPDLIRRIGEVTALEMRVTGIDWTFAPTLAVAQNDRWGRTYESYSENPAIVRAFAGAMVTGLQGAPDSPDFLGVNRVVSTAKHFVGDGGTERGDDQGDARVTEAELARIHAAGYETALRAGAQSVMASFSSWNGQKMHGNRYLLTDVLKGRMGFDGFIVGDWNGHGQVPGCTNASCPQAINAGLDLFMAIEDWKDLYANTLAQVKAGEIPMARLDDAVSRILRVKLRAGLFEKGRPSSRGVAGADGIIGSPEHRAVARQAVRESLVLLKNRNGVLPINPGKTILVAGDGADNIGKQSGGWTISWQGTGNVNSDFPGATSVYAGIRDAVSSAGGTAILSPNGFYTVKPDVAIVVIGEDPYAEGQGDLDTLEFEAGTKPGLALLRKLKADGIPVVTVFLSGRPLWTNPELNASDAFVAAWLPGSEGGGVADLLIAGADGSARHDFKGRLSFSWPRSPLQDVLNPHHDGYDPLFALGYGLTYQGGEQGPGELAEAMEGVMSTDLADLRLYRGRPMAPWMVVLEDGRTAAQLSGAYAAVPSGIAELTTVDKDIQGDALRLRSLRSEPASLALVGGTAVDLTPWFEHGAAMTFDLRVRDGAGVTGRLDLECGEDCTLSHDLTAQFADAAAGGDWRSVAVPLSCLAKDAAGVSAITVPFRLAVDGKADVEIADVRLALVGEEARTCNLN